MDSFKKLQEKMKELEKESGHKGYYYKISDALTIMICGMLCNLQNISDIYEWSKAEPVREFLFKEFNIYRLPSRAQFYNLLGYVKPERFQELFIQWVKEILHNEDTEKTIAIDGKTICSASQRSGDGEPLHILSAIISESKMIIGSMPCDTKITEPKIFRELVGILDISGAVVVADALHCQKKSAEKVVEEQGDYLFVVKDNVPTLRGEIELYVQNEEMDKYVQTELNGGRIEKRTAYTTTEIDWITGKSQWKNLTTIGAIHTEFTKDGITSSEWHYYISSRKLTPQELLKHARMEWAVESIHWLLDVHFQEDKTKVWNMNVQKNLNIMRKIALNLARLYKNRYEPRMAISGILKSNLFDINNLAKFIRFFIAVISISELLQN